MSFCYRVSHGMIYILSVHVLEHKLVRDKMTAGEVTVG
jgi:hypothetical protein